MPQRLGARHAPVRIGAEPVGLHMRFKLPPRSHGPLRSDCRCAPVSVHWSESGLFGLQGSIDGSAYPRRHGTVVSIGSRLDPLEHLGREPHRHGVGHSRSAAPGSRASRRTRAPLRESCLRRSSVLPIAGGQMRRGDIAPDGLAPVRRTRVHLRGRRSGVQVYPMSSRGSSRKGSATLTWTRSSHLVRVDSLSYVNRRSHCWIDADAKWIASAGLITLMPSLFD